MNEKNGALWHNLFLKAFVSEIDFLKSAQQWILLNFLKSQQK